MTGRARRTGVRTARKSAGVCPASGKAMYSHTEAAKHAARGRRRRDGDVLSEYLCRACGWWHYGNDPKLTK